MILSDGDIARYRDGGRLHLEPFDPVQMNPASYDLTLAPTVRFPASRSGQVSIRPVEPLDVAAIEENYTTLAVMSPGGWLLSPHDFILAVTNEVVHVPDDLVARVEGKSSHGRIGLAVHITAGFIDPGFRGSITLEIVNLFSRPILLRPNMRIAQIAFTVMTAVPLQTYGATGHYQDQALESPEPIESRFRM